MSKHPASDILRAVEDANLPATTDITSTLERAKEVLQEEAGKKGYLTSERKLGQDAASFVETTKEFIEEKNQGELMQKIVKDAAFAIEELTQMMETTTFWKSREQMITMKVQAKNYSKFAQQRLDSLKNLAFTLINSSQFRGLIVDFIELVQQTFNIEIQSAPSLKPEKDSTEPLTEEVKSKAEEVQEFGKQVAKDIKEGALPIPEDKKQEINFRFKSILRSLANNPDYRIAVDGLLTLMDQLHFYLTQVGEQVTEEVSEKKQAFFGQDSAVFKFFTDFKTFLSGFTEEKPLDNFNNDIYDFFQLVMKDDKLSSFFWDCREFLIEVLSNPQLLDNIDYTEKWNEIYERATSLLNDPYYSTLWNKIWSDLRICIDNIKNDPLQQKLASDASTLASDLFLDTNGKPSLNILGSSLNNLRNLLLPLLQKYLENVPIPSMSGTNQTYDWIIEGLFLNGKEILPENIELKVWGRATVPLTIGASTKALTYLTMWIRNMKLEAKDLKFWFNRKVLPKIEERGICDVDIKGFNELKITWRIEGDQDQAWEFAVEQVRCNLESLDITIKESTHTWMMKFITTLFAGSIRTSIENTVEKNIKEGMGTVNDKMNDTLKGIGF